MLDLVIQAAVQTQKDYSWHDTRSGQRFVEICIEHGGGKLTVDYGHLHDTEGAPISDLCALSEGYIHRFRKIYIRINVYVYENTSEVDL